MTIQPADHPDHLPRSAPQAAPEGAGVLAMPTVTGGSMPGLAILGDWLHAASSAEQLARQLVSSFFVPAAYKPNGPNGVDVAVANATGAILLGQSLGLDPLTSLQQIYVVHGRPGMYTKLKVALAQARGHRVWDEEYGPERVTVCGQRRGTDDIVRITVTIDDAKRAGWYEQNANYKKTPADMLWARAAGRVVDRVAADVLFGLASIEDLVDEPAPAARVTIDDVRGTTPAAAEPAAIAAAPTGDGRIDERTWRDINATFVALGVTGPGQNERRLEAIRRIVGHPVSKGRELSAVQGDLVLDTLRGLDRAGMRDLLAGDPDADGQAAESRGGASTPRPSSGSSEAAPDERRAPTDGLLSGPEGAPAPHPAGEEYDPSMEPGFGQDGGPA